VFDNIGIPKKDKSPPIITHTTKSNINMPMFLRGKIPVEKLPWPEPMWPLGEIYQ